ncbi:MAG: mannose-1-phosphate guanylyltransferase/mannose-6-phosphate isomerase [Pseudomonadota bacterium]|nr:mannose-1-phosphate guanylyltransferase/mannose-6-phosphate isomerase [Pseudomonadota bacterium]
MDGDLIPVILSGGVGSRLWPLSRETRPKPFIKLNDGDSLIGKTYRRAVGLAGGNEIVTVTNRELYFFTRDEYNETGISETKNTFILEPVARNSTAAIALAAHYISRKHGPDTLMLILPADHLVLKSDELRKAVMEAQDLANKGSLVTFGITPTGPNTAYGYIEAEGNKVKSFREKPDATKAREYIERGKYLWNSGMFCMSASLFLSELSSFQETIKVKTSSAMDNAIKTSSRLSTRIEILHKDFVDIPDISVDYAVFENSSLASVVPCEIGWSDIGSWDELGRLLPEDDSSNHHSGNSLLVDCKNLIVNAGKRLVVAHGVENLVIADTTDALLVISRDKLQEVRNIVSRLKEENRPEFATFPEVHRPWGTYTTLQEANNYKLKLIQVKPGARLSLQSHQYRSEHWIVVSGEATITNDGEETILTANQSTYISKGSKHRLGNAAVDQLFVIEVQCGENLDENDIVRYEDNYGRLV